MRTSDGRIALAVVCMMCVVIGAAAAPYVPVLRELGDLATKNSALSYVDREVAGGNGLVADQSAPYAARALIPADATYHVAVSPDYSRGSELTVPFAESYYTYFLLPRRPADDARWVVCYGCELRNDDAHADVVWDGAEGVSILRRR